MALVLFKIICKQYQKDKPNDLLPGGVIGFTDYDILGRGLGNIDKKELFYVESIKNIFNDLTEESTIPKLNDGLLGMFNITYFTFW